MDFCENLTFLRKSKGLSQEELAFLIGVSRQTLHTWEVGIASPNVSMLKKLSKALDVKIAELVEGKTIANLPKRLKEYSLEYVSESDPVNASGLLNWFIKLEVGNELSFGLYDDGLKDYSYHLSVLNEIVIHNKKGFEILVEEYDKDLRKENSYSLVATKIADKMQFLAKIEMIDGVKTIQTFKDKSFLKSWGEEMSTFFDNAKNYILTYGEKKFNVIQISYLLDNSYFECYVDKNLETLLWRRFDKNLPSKERRTFDGNSYGFFYEVITDRLT